MDELSKLDVRVPPGFAITTEAYELFITHTGLQEAIAREIPNEVKQSIIDAYHAEFSKVRAGDVLVAPFTNPAWTPLFQRVAAVVVDSGSVGSHAAIVAREYGIPAVMGTIDGTSKLRDGEMVRVDGTQGYVFSS